MESGEGFKLVTNIEWCVVESVKRSVVNEKLVSSGER